jgi:hypothetical protein
MRMKNAIQHAGTVLAVVVLAATAHGQTPTPAEVHWKKGYTPADKPIGKAKDVASMVKFIKDTGEPFTITWVSAKPNTLKPNPCKNPVTDKHPVCELIADVCKPGNGDSNKKCYFTYRVDGDPDIVIDEGNNPPPPHKDVKKAESEVKAAQKAFKSAAKNDKAGKKK